MRVKSLLGLVLSFLALTIVGCGGGGGGASTTVKGVAAAAAIADGTVTLFSINAQGQTTQLTTTPTTVKTKAFGNFSAAVSYSGPLLVKITGGTYKDEASGLTLTNGTLQAAVANVTGTVANVSVTPLTTVAAQLAPSAAGATIADQIQNANTSVAKALRLPSTVDIISTPVTDSNYAFSLATISQGALTSSGNSTDPAVLAAAAADVVASLADPTKGIDTTSGTVKDPSLNQAVTQATQDAFNNPNIVPPGTTPPVDPTAVAGVTLTAAPATGVINNSVTITANVSAISSAVKVANGTTVTFTTSAGTITASATTTNGIATATLSGITTPQVVSVSAAVGTISSSALPVTFIADPNAPGAISLAASTASLFVGQGPVTLTATVSPAGAGGVIADGTVVTFVTSLGTLAAPTTTTNGKATVTLNSVAAGTASVTARVNGITSAPVSVQFKAQPTLAIVKIATTGTLPAATTIGGVNVIASASPSTGLSIAPADIAASGAGIGSTLVPNTNSVAAINLALINTSGIQVGEFATLTYHVAAGSFPKTADFTAALTGAGVINTLGANIPGIGVTVLSVTVQ